jgi:hypothetical protein
MRVDLTVAYFDDEKGMTEYNWAVERLSSEKRKKRENWLTTDCLSVSPPWFPAPFVTANQILVVVMAFTAFVVDGRPP